MNTKFWNPIFWLVLFLFLTYAPAWSAVTVSPWPGGSEGNVPWTVDFLVNGTDPSCNATFRWNFGDGIRMTGISHIQTHTFNTPGYYTVACFVEYVGGCNNGQATTDVVAYKDGYALLDSVTATPSSGPAPLTVEFSCTTFGQVSSFSWNFGDETTGTGSSVKHTYESCGRYQVTCTARDAAGHRESKTVTVSVGGELISNITANPGTGPAPLTVNFSCVPLVNESLAYTWTFGDGRSDSGQDKTSVSMTYSIPGTYNATCRVINEHGCIDIKSVPVVVRSGKSDLIAKLTAKPEQGDPPLNVVFTCESHDPMQIERYEWDFDDGTIKNGTAVETHRYVSVGVYVAKCRVFDFSSRWDEATVVIRVGQPEVAVAGTWHVYGAELLANGALNKMYSGSWTMTPNGDMSNSHIQMASSGVIKAVTGNIYLDVWKNLGGYFRTDSDYVRVESGTICADNEVAQFFGQFLQGPTMTHVEQVFMVRNEPSTVFTPGDMTGTWHYFLWQAGPGGQSTHGGYVEFDNLGNVVDGSRWKAGLSSLFLDGTLDGNLIGSGVSDILKAGTMSRNKDAMVWLLEHGEGGYGLGVLLKGGGAHSQSEMAQEWYLSRMRTPSWSSILEYGVLKPDLYGIPSEGRFKTVDALNCGTWKAGLLSILTAGHIHGYLTDENDKQANIMYGQMGRGKKMAGLWTQDNSTERAITLMIAPPQGWKAPDMTCSGGGGGNSTDGGGGGGGCVASSGSGQWVTWLLLGIVWLVIRLAMVRRRA